MNVRGSSKDAVETLQGLFTEAVLKLPELPPDPRDERVYDLNPLAQRGFQFVYDPGSGIERVAVKKLRLSSRLRSGDRITLEADTSKSGHAIHDLLDRLGQSALVRLYNVSQVELSVTIQDALGKRPKRIVPNYPSQFLFAEI